jgi:hypothetical protein
MANPDGTAATTWTAQTGGSSTTANTVTDSNGAMPNWIEEGEYDQTIDGVTKRVQAVAASGLTSTRVESYRGIAANDAAMWQAAITAATSSGTTGGRVVGGQGVTYNFSAGSVPTIEPSLPTKLTLDLNGSVIKLSSTVPRAFDLHRTADYQTFQNIEVCNGTIDQNNVGGRHHIILGNYQAGVVQQRCNFDRLHVHDMRVINAPVDPTVVTHLHALHFNLTTTASSEGTQLTATNMLFERIDVQGAGVGIYVGGNATAGGTATISGAQVFPLATVTCTAPPTGFPPTGSFTIAGVTGTVSYTGISGSTFTGCTGGTGTAANGAALTGVATTSTPNAYVDNITINDLRHDLGSVQPSNFASCHIQIGQNALVGTININRLRGFNSGDVGVELDNIRDGYINDSHVTDSYGYSFYKTNFNTTANPNGQGKDWSVNAQFMRFIDCRAVRQNFVIPSANVTLGRRFVIADSGNNLQIGTVIFERCSMHSTAADTAKATLGEFMKLGGLVGRVIVSDCEATIENIANASGTNSPAMFYTDFSGNTATMLTVRGLRLRASGSVAGGTFNFYGMQINQSTLNLDMNFDIDAPEFDFAITAAGGTINNLIAIDIGRVGLRASGSISNWKAPNFGTFSGRIAVSLGATTTFSCRGLMIDQPDFNSAAATEINFGGSGSTSNASKTLVDTVVRWSNNNSVRSPAGRVATAANYAMTAFDKIVSVTSTAAARTITLPFVAAVPPGQVYTIKDESNAAATNNISGTAQSGEFWEDGATATKAINTNAGFLAFYSNGTRWQKVG